MGFDYVVTGHIPIRVGRFPPHGCGCCFYGAPIPFGRRFECFGHALLLRHSGNYDFHTLVAGLVDFGQVLEQCTLHHIVGVKDFTMFFQIVTAQTSVFADLIIAVIRQNKVRDEIIAHLTIYAALQNRQLSEEDRIQMQFENSSSLVQL